MPTIGYVLEVPISMATGKNQNAGSTYANPISFKASKVDGTNLGQYESEREAKNAVQALAGNVRFTWVVDQLIGSLRQLRCDVP